MQNVQSMHGIFKCIMIVICQFTLQHLAPLSYSSLVCHCQGSTWSQPFVGPSHFLVWILHSFTVTASVYYGSPGGPPRLHYSATWQVEIISLHTASAAISPEFSCGFRPIGTAGRQSDRPILFTCNSAHIVL